jgi:hypothetical protein
MIGRCSLVALGLAGVVTTASLPASAQVGLPGYQPLPPGYSPNQQGYGQPPPMVYANPVMLGLGIGLGVVGAGLLAGGFAALAVDSQNAAIGPALLGLGGTFFVASIPMLIVGAHQVPAGPPPGYGPGMSRRRWIGSPRIVLPTARNGETFALGWAWEM